MSNEPCDFRPPDKTGVAGPYAQSGGPSPGAFFVLAPATSNYHPTLVPGRVYYVNIRNALDGVNTCPLRTCDVVIKSRSQ